MKCEKCNKNSDILKLSLNEKLGWLCEDCALETHTALNLFLEKKHNNEIGDNGDE